MARATTSTVKRMVYDNLGLTDQTAGYGNLQTNERYLSGYIDDNIVYADIVIAKILFKNKQNSLLDDLLQNSAVASEDPILQNWGISYVTHTYLGAEYHMYEISYEEYERYINQAIYSLPALTDGYYAIQDNKIFIYNDSGNAKIYYIDFTHPTTLTTLMSPSGFEGAVAHLASAMLLMKRADKPEQAQWHYTMFKEFMQGYMLPESNVPESVDNMLQLR